MPEMMNLRPFGRKMEGPRRKPARLYWIYFWILMACEMHARAQTNIFPEFQIEKAREYMQTVSQMVEGHSGANVEVQFINARLESQLGHKAEAERLARLALDRDPKRADIQVFLADIFIRQDRLDDAAKALRQAIEADPRHKGAHRRLGMVLDRLGNGADALAALEKAIQTNPDDSLARLLLGRMLLSQGKAAAAKVELERACQLDAQSANAYYALFQCQTQIGDQEAAKKTLQTFRELKKQEKSAMDVEETHDNEERDLRAYTAEFHVNVAGQLLREGQESLAEEHLRQALRIAPKDTQALEILAGFYIKKGRHGDARPLLVSLADIRPRDTATRLNLGTVLLQLKDPDAIPELKRVLELDPQQPQALNNIARYYLSRRQQLPEALVLCQRLVAVQPSAFNFDLLGWAYYANGRTNDALAASAQAVEKEPGNAVFRQRYDRLKQVAGAGP